MHVVLLQSNLMLTNLPLNVPISKSVSFIQPVCQLRSVSGVPIGMFSSYEVLRNVNYGNIWLLKCGNYSLSWRAFLTTVII